MTGKQPKRKPRPGVDEYGRNLLHEAAIRGELNSINEELSKGGSINAQDDNGWTALHFAAQGNHSAIVNELLRKGADANLVNTHGNGPLWVAVMIARGDLILLRRRMRRQLLQPHIIIMQQPVLRILDVNTRRNVHRIGTRTWL